MVYINDILSNFDAAYKIKMKQIIVKQIKNGRPIKGVRKTIQVLLFRKISVVGFLIELNIALYANALGSIDKGSIAFIGYTVLYELNNGFLNKLLELGEDVVDVDGVLDRSRR